MKVSSSEDISGKLRTSGNGIAWLNLEGSYVRSRLPHEDTIAHRYSGTIKLQPGLVFASARTILGEESFEFAKALDTIAHCPDRPAQQWASLLQYREAKAKSK